MVQRPPGAKQTLSISYAFLIQASFQRKSEPMRRCSGISNVSSNRAEMIMESSQTTKPETIQKRQSIKSNLSSV